MEGSSSSSSSSSLPDDVGMTSVESTPEARMAILGVGESCSFQPLDSRGCRPARSCQSCLETKGCMISTIGKCVSPRDVAYNPSIEYHNAIDRELVVTDATQAREDDRLRAPQSWQFPAGSARYCDASDAACGACVRNNFWRSNSSFPDSRFCLGDDGSCVCVDVCERRWYVQDDCSSAMTTPVPGYYLTSENIAERLWRGLLGMGVFVLIVLIVMLRRKRQMAQIERARQVERERQLEARRARRHARSRQLGVDTLTLTGWETYRRDLIDKEAAQLAGGDESRTGETLDNDDDSLSSGDDGGEIRSPRATEAASTAYVSLEESGPGNTSTRPAVSITATSSAAATTREANRARVAAYNEATPSRQLLAPIRSNRASI